MRKRFVYLLWLELSKSSDCLQSEMDGEEDHFESRSNACHARTMLAKVVPSFIQKLINRLKLLIFLILLFPKNLSIYFLY
ncbi:hypothetical protein A946_04170 [Methylacidiphilum kamchatkense Kam1]|uniref:Uncharacterized protein n=1 Tax=Methylacidiphilum kamchatkense Kam1 TaxID=1202785 RepID=A0ABR4ZWN5_9BACT|nr:hypothetical protein A946_04170 [Methylacidiphilum kamchatkense Kam1]